MERASGLRAVGRLRVAAKSRGELETFLAEKIAEEMPAPDQAAAPYVLLGLLEPGADLGELMLSLHLEQVAGFYEPDSAALFVLADHPEALLEPLLVHELVHALQDQHVGLDSLTARRRGADARAAARAAIEGHAMLAAAEWSGAPDARRSADALRAAVLADAGARYPLLAAAPAVVRESVLFPYVEGMRFARAAWVRDRNRAAALTVRMPRSTEQVFHPDKLWGASPDLPVALAFSFSGDDGPVPLAASGDASAPGAVGERPSPFRPRLGSVREDVLGHLELGLVAEAWGGDRSMADGWAGDRYALFGSPGRWSLRWVVAWDDRARRDAFLGWAKDAPGRPSGLALRALEVGGLAALEVVAGAPPAWVVRVARDGGPGP